MKINPQNRQNTLFSFDQASDRKVLWKIRRDMTEILLKVA